MQKTPCEMVRWQIIPSIRRELAWYLVNDYSLSHVQVAKKLGLTPAAICQYLHGKRGATSFNENIKLEIAYSAAQIMREGPKATQQEICRICLLIQKEPKHQKINE